MEISALPGPVWSLRYRLLASCALALISVLSSEAVAQQAATAGPYMVQITNDPKSIVSGIPSVLDILVMNAQSMAPVEGLKITAKLSMQSMTGMKLDSPKVVSGQKAGHYDITVLLPENGAYSLSLGLQPQSGKATSVTFTITPGVSQGTSQQMPGMKLPGKEPMPEMADMNLKGIYGPWPMSREGSGTSWQPDASPMFMKELSTFAGFHFDVMGTLQGGYVDAGGKRGDKDFFTNSMVMVMGHKALSGGTLGLHFMSSFDPILNSRRGVPNLFQNGFDVHGSPVADRKDPHNFFAELAASYSRCFCRDWSGFIYGGPVGEPALGNVMYFHRPSGLELPEAPISHDWFDGTHISFGVATIGMVYKDKWKVEGSTFNGHDPIGLYNIGPVAFNSASGRLSYNPSSDWSLSASYGYLNSDVNEHRFTASAAYSHALTHGNNLSVTTYLGQNIVHGAKTSNGWLLEATYYHRDDGMFVRFERVDKDGLDGVPAGSFTVNKLLFGDVHNFESKDHLDYGLGAYAGLYSFPSALKPFYGSSPVTLGVFLRIRPSKM